MPFPQSPCRTRQCRFHNLRDGHGIAVSTISAPDTALPFPYRCEATIYLIYSLSQKDEV
ncbi:hypothetical protein QUA56_14130 [Microcoleus sp. N3A4]|uniref:hypothetical protein n=1 Tax=Microcoleus sp. N3A4 TaxID=3055379 RepID=UPI002FD07CEB